MPFLATDQHSSQLLSRDAEPMAEPWQLLVAFLNLHRRIPLESWPRASEDARRVRDAAQADIPAMDLQAWNQFAAAVHVPYFATMDFDRPVLWVKAQTGLWYGFEFHFGLQPDRWNWWVAGQPLRVVPDDTPGRFRLVMLEQHAAAAESLAIDDLLAALPPTWFPPDPDTLSLRAILDEELRQHSAEERNRCRFYVYPFDSPAHGTDAWSEGSFGLQSLAATYGGLEELAWTWLSPLVEFWAYDIRAAIALNVAEDPGLERASTVTRLQQLTPQQKWVMVADGVDGYPGLGDPFGPLWSRIQRLTVVRARGDRRITEALRRAATGHFPLTTDAAAPATRSWIQTTAKDRLARTSHPVEYSVTTDVWAAVALQVQWAVEAQVTLLACPHPGCGRAFVRNEPGVQYCPDHRSVAARQVRSRWRASVNALGGS